MSRYPIPKSVITIELDTVLCQNLERMAEKQRRKVKSIVRSAVKGHIMTHGFGPKYNPPPQDYPIREVYS